MSIDCTTLNTVHSRKCIDKIFGHRKHLDKWQGYSTLNNIVPVQPMKVQTIGIFYLGGKNKSIEIPGDKLIDVIDELCNIRKVKKIFDKYGVVVNDL